MTTLDMTSANTVTATIAVAGASGDLGARITRALVARGAHVRALIRPGTDQADRDRLVELGATLTPADPTDVDSMANALAGVDCVVSALNGLREVSLDRQSLLLDAAVRAGVPRFISSDFSADFTKTPPGHNRNFDLRREFMGRADRASIQVTSILNGAFMDMLGAEMPLIQPGSDGCCSGATRTSRSTSPPRTTPPPMPQRPRWTPTPPASSASPATVQPSKDSPPSCRR